MCGETNSRSATSRLVNPCATSRATASSESVIAAQPRPGPLRGDEAASHSECPQPAPHSAGIPGGSGLGVQFQRPAEDIHGFFGGAIVDSGGAKVIQRCRERQGAGAALVEPPPLRQGPRGCDRTTLSRARPQRRWIGHRG